MKMTVKLVLGLTAGVLAVILSKGLVGPILAFVSGALLDSMVAEKMSANLKAKFEEILEREI